MKIKYIILENNNHLPRLNKLIKFSLKTNTPVAVLIKKYFQKFKSKNKKIEYQSNS